MAFKRVLEGATEIKELITYRDKTKTSVGYGKAEQVLKTDGRHIYWGEGGTGEIIKDVETVLSNGNPFVWNLKTGERSEKIYLNTTLSYDEVLAILKTINYVSVQNVGDVYSVAGIPILGDSIWIAREYFDEVNFRYVISGADYFWISHDNNGNEKRTNNGWSFNLEHISDGYLEKTEYLSGVLPVSMPADVVSMGFTDEFVGTQNDKLSRLISSTTDFGGIELPEDKLYRIPTDDTYRLVHVKNGVAYEVANEDDVTKLGKRVEALEEVKSGESSDSARITEQFTIDSNRTYFIKLNKKLSEGEYIKLADCVNDTSAIIYVFQQPDGGVLTLSAGDPVNVMNSFTLVANTENIYSSQFISIINGYVLQPTKESDTTDAYFINYVEEDQPVNITSDNISEYVNLEPIDLGGFLNIDGAIFSLDGAKVIEEHYTKFLQNKTAPIKIGEHILQMEIFIDESNNNYTARYVFSTNVYRYYVVICWNYNPADLNIDEIYSEFIGGNSSESVLNIDNLELSFGDSKSAILGYDNALPFYSANKIKITTVEGFIIYLNLCFKSSMEATPEDGTLSFNANAYTPDGYKQFYFNLTGDTYYWVVFIPEM